MTQIHGSISESARSVSDTPRVPADRTGSGSDQWSSAVDVSSSPTNGRSADSQVVSLDDRQRLQATAARLRPDLPNIDKLLRLGAVALVDRCEAFCEKRPNVGPGYLAQLIIQGGPPAETKAARSTVSVVPAARPCPLAHEPALLADLDRRWREIESQIRIRLGHDAALVWDTWMFSGHLHRIDGGIELGVSPIASAWVGRRYGRLVTTIAGSTVTYVACGAAS